MNISYLKRLLIAFIILKDNFAKEHGRQLTSEVIMVCNWYDRCYFARINRCYKIDDNDCSIATAFYEREKREEFKNSIKKEKGSN